MINILFLCTGNSCRSQMAEGFARGLGGEAVRATSAGIEAHGLNPKAVAVMREVAVDISQQQSRIITDHLVGSADVVVTVCDHAREHCPVIPGHKRQLHWSFDDPAKATGTDDEIMREFRRVRDEIKTQVQNLVNELIGEHGAD